MENENGTIAALKREQFYPLIPLIWILLLLIVFGCFVIISYLRSKPPLSQTVMDYANMITFIYFLPQSVLTALYITLAIQSLDYGEFMASWIGYSIPAFGDITTVQICTILIIQAIMIKNPEYLDNGTFEKTVKCIMTVVIPLYNGIIYTCLYIASEPTAFYITLRRFDHNHINYKVVLIRVCTFLPVVFATALNLLYTIKIQQENFIQSNHILNTRVVLVTVIGNLVLFGLTYAFVSKIFPFQDIISILFPMVLAVIKSVFIVTIMLTHNGVRGYLSNLYLIRNFTTLLTVRQVRQITADKNNIELHGMT